MANTTSWLSMTKLRDQVAAYGLAMSIGLVKLGINGGMVFTAAPIFLVAQSQSVPISRGSPPIS